MFVFVAGKLGKRHWKRSYRPAGVVAGPVGDGVAEGSNSKARRAAEAPLMASVLLRVHVPT